MSGLGDEAELGERVGEVPGSGVGETPGSGVGEAWTPGEARVSRVLLSSE